jgi:hypothetical protein
MYNVGLLKIYTNRYHNTSSSSKKKHGQDILTWRSLADKE